MSLSGIYLDLKAGKEVLDFSFEAVLGFICEGLGVVTFELICSFENWIILTQGWVNYHLGLLQGNCSDNLPRAAFLPCFQPTVSNNWNMQRTPVIIGQKFSIGEKEKVTFNSSLILGNNHSLDTFTQFKYLRNVNARVVGTFWANFEQVSLRR